MASPRKRSSGPGRTRGASVEVTDAGVAEAVADAVGHGPPFGAAELAAIEALHVLRARDIGVLAACTRLRRLILDQSEVTSLAALSGLPALARINASYNALRDIAAVRDLPEITTVRVNANLIEDIEPLLGLDLQEVAVIGNPLSERSFREVLPLLRTTSTRLYRVPPRVIASDEEQWGLTRELQARGFDAVFVHSEQTPRTFVLRPGLRHGNDPEGHAVPITAAQLRDELARPDLRYDDLLARYRECS